MAFQSAIFYSPIFNSDLSTDKSSKNVHSKLVNSSTFHEQQSTSLSAFIAAKSPTYIFDPDDITEDKSFYLSNIPLNNQSINTPSQDGKDLHSKIQLVSDLFLYPELSLSKSYFFNQNVGSLSQISNIPSIPEIDRVHCFCHKNTKSPIIKCSVCNSWSHLKCYNLPEDRVPDIFICLYCQNALVTSMKQQIRTILATIKKRLRDHCDALTPIEKKASKSTLDKLIQINGIPQFKRICYEMNEYSQNSRKIWEEICEARDHIQKILNESLIEQSQDESESYDEAEDTLEPPKSDYSE